MVYDGLYKLRLPSVQHRNEGKMEKEKFIQEFLEGLEHNEEWGLTADNIRLYRDGATADGDKEDLEFIRSTNIRYHKVESDTLIGDFVSIMKERNNKMKGMCRFEVALLQRTLEQEGWDGVWDIVRQNIKQWALLDSDVLSKLEDYQAIREHLIIRPINYADNRYELKNCIYKKEGDIALVLYMRVCDNEAHGLSTVKMQKKSLEDWKEDEDKVWEDALLNTYVLAPPRMYMTPMESDKPSYTKGAFMAIGSKINRILPLQVPIVTTTRQTNGAIALFYPGVKERIAEMAGGSFYVAFTSIHEARIHCAHTISPRQVLRGLKDVNKSFDPKEVLSRKVFCYDAEKKTFSAMEL